MTALDLRALRSAFGCFMTGVTVVTTRAPDGALCGFTANSFSSVSLDPPLLLVCPGRNLSTFKTFAECTHFAVNVLAEGQEDISNTFAGFKGDRFARVRHRPDGQGNPLIDGAAAQFSCATWQSLPAGDHQILIGEVKDFTHSDAPGLGYAGGQYFSLGLERAASEPNTGAVICGAIIAMGDTVLLDHTCEGLCPPQIMLTNRGRLRRDLQKALLARGIDLQLGPAYSVYDDAQNRTHYTYFLGESAAIPANDNMQAVPIRDLPSLTFATPAITNMMNRYTLEFQTRSLGLYLGDAQSGDVHSPTERI